MILGDARKAQPDTTLAQAPRPSAEAGAGRLWFSGPGLFPHPFLTIRDKAKQKPVPLSWALPRMGSLLRGSACVPHGLLPHPIAPSPGSWAAPVRGPHPEQAGPLSSVWLGLTCEIDGHGHDDDDDAHDEEGDAEQSGQAAQPPGPVQVPLLHAASRLQRQGGRDLRNAGPSRPQGVPLPGPPEPTQPPPQPIVQHPPWGREAGFSCRTGPGTSCGTPQPSLPLTASGSKQSRALPLRMVMRQVVGGMVETEGPGGWARARPC